jgi:hypothetical protein
VAASPVEVVRLAAPLVAFFAPEPELPAFFRVDFEPVAMRMLLMRRCVRDTKQELGTHRYLRKGEGDVRLRAQRSARYILRAARAPIASGWDSRATCAACETRGRAATLQLLEGQCAQS